MNSPNKLGLKQKFYIFLWYVLFKVALDFSCTNVFYILSRDLQANRPIETQIISWVLYIIQILFVIKFVVKRNDLLAVLFNLLFILNGVGFFSIYGFKTTTTLEGFLTGFLFWIVFAIAVGVMPKSKKSRHSTSIKSSNLSTQQANISVLELLLFIGCVGVTLVLSGVYGNFRIFISFDDVYSYRQDFANASVPTIVAYIVRWLSGVLMPYFFSRFLILKKWPLAAATLLSGLFLYGIDGLKTTLVIYAVVIYFTFIFTSRKHIAIHNAYVYVIVGLTIGLFVGAVSFKITRDYLFNVELYRVLIIPSQIADNYFLFINRGEALLLRESIFRFFADSPYVQSINYLVSSSSNIVANTGLYGDAYANFKIVGVITYPFIYAGIFRKWQTICNENIDMVSVSLGFIMIWNAINISFFTWLLTGGVLLFFFLFKFMKVRISI